ncbi:MAG: hypothetical protein IKW06_02710 [Clostridia bacterium]|nr:hypothetical protein [Clostridia bacterium]
MEKMRTKKTGLISCLLVVLAALANLASRDKSGRDKKAILYRFSFPCFNRAKKPVAKSAMSAYIQGLAAAKGCGLAGGHVSTAEEGKVYVFYLLLTEDRQISSIGESVKRRFNLASYEYSREERFYN